MRRTAEPLRVSPLLIGLGLLVACSSSHDIDAALDHDAAVNPRDDQPILSVTSSGLCTRLAEIECEAEQHCCSSGRRSAQSCQNELQQSCAQNLFLDEIASQPRTAFDAAAAERAFDELASRASRCDVGVLRWIPGDEGIRSIFQGTLGAGESCKPAAGLTSSPALLAAALAACRHSDALACLPQSLLGDWTCTPKQPAGRTCVTDDNCADNTACNNFSQVALGACIGRLPLAAACTYASECESLYCDDGKCSEPSMDAVYCSLQ